MKANNLIANWLVFILVVILGLQLFLIHTEAVLYQPGVKAGMEMKYQFSHYPDIKEAVVQVEKVEGSFVTLKTTSFYYDGSVKEEIITINIAGGNKTVLVPTNTLENWQSIQGKNALRIVDDYLEINMEPEAGYARVDYTFPNPLDMNEVSHFYYFFSIGSSAEGEKYTIWMIDANGKSKYFPIEIKPDDPKMPEYLSWDKKEWFNFNTISAEELDKARIKMVSLVYEGNSTRIIKLKSFETDDPLTHGSGNFKYFIVASNLVKGDPLYPDVPYVINEELPSEDDPSPVIFQHSYRNLAAAYADCQEGFCSSVYTYDKETGILVRYWTAKSGVQIQLIDQKNAWAAPNLGALAIAIIQETWIYNIQPYFWYIAGLISIYVIGFVMIAIYDKLKRGTLSIGMMRQWWPFLMILLIMFVLGEVIRRLGV